MIDAAPARAVDLFFSYAHKDERLRERLERHLSTPRNEGLVADWYDGRIQPGKDWDDEIRGYLDRADIILFLVSGGVAKPIPVEFLGDYSAIVGSEKNSESPNLQTACPPKKGSGGLTKSFGNTTLCGAAIPAGSGLTREAACDSETHP
jgi:hypothetical protein